jgi:hypothetical protein
LFQLDINNLAVGLLMNFCTFIKHWLSADDFQIPPHRQCVNVSNYTMTDLEISKLILNEFDKKTLGVTSQYLEIHEPIYENKQLKIDRIDREKNTNTIIAYLPVKDEYFFFSVYIDNKTEEIFNISTESRNLVSVIFASETMTSDELKLLTKLNCQEFWNKGDKKPNRKATYKFSGIEFYPNYEPDEFEDKLEKLLAFIEHDKEGILLLSTKSKGYIHVLMDFHRGNQLLGGINIEAETLKRISNLNLSIDFQITAWGNSFK